MATKAITATLIEPKYETELYELVAELVEKQHADLHEKAVLLLFWKTMAPDRDEKITYAKAALPNDVHRSLREHDGQIFLNEEFWDTLVGDQKKFILDQELHKFVRVRDKETGAEKQDDAGRPVFRLKAFDFSGFHAVIRRWPEEAMELGAPASMKVAGAA